MNRYDLPQGLPLTPRIIEILSEQQRKKQRKEKNKKILLAMIKILFFPVYFAFIPTIYYLSKK